PLRRVVEETGTNHAGMFPKCAKPANQLPRQVIEVGAHPSEQLVKPRGAFETGLRRNPVERVCRHKQIAIVLSRTLNYLHAGDGVPDTSEFLQTLDVPLKDVRSVHVLDEPGGGGVFLPNVPDAGLAPTARHGTDGKAVEDRSPPVSRHAADGVKHGL